MKGQIPSPTESHCPRLWQNPFYVVGWESFWVMIAIQQIMSLFDRPAQSLMIYSGDLCEIDKVRREAEKIIIQLQSNNNP